MRELQYSDQCDFREYDYFIDCTVVAERKLLKYFSTTKVMHVRLRRQAKRASSYHGPNYWFWTANQDEVDRKSNRVLNTAYQQWQIKQQGEQL